MNEQKVHIAFITNDQQASIKVLLKNLLALQFKASLGLVTNGGNKGVQENIMMRNLDLSYGMLTTFSSLKRSDKGNAFYLSPVGIKLLIKAMDTYDKKNTVLDETEQSTVNRTFQKLRLLLGQSAECEFTMDEIKKAGGA